MKSRAVGTILLAAAWCAPLATAQTPLGTGFTYQGRLGDGGTPATGTYDVQLSLFDAPSAGAQAGSTLTRDDVVVANGLFTVTLDFGAVFGGSKRWLQLGVRPGASTGAFVLLAPRQELAPAPNAVWSASAATATSFSGGLSGDVSGTQGATVVSSVGGQVAASVASATQSVGAATSSSTINTLVRRNANGGFSASVIDATTQYNIGGDRVLGTSNASVYLGSAGAGVANVGLFNTFVGHGSGANNVDGSLNVFVGMNAGHENTQGGFNVFLGADAGRENTTGGANTFVGRYAGRVNTTGVFNSFFGADAGVSTTVGLRNAFFGGDSGRSNTDGQDNSFFGVRSGLANTAGSRNAFVGAESGKANTLGNFNAFVGDNSGSANTTGWGNTIIGSTADVGSGDLTTATAIGFGALVTQSFSMVLGSNNVKVGIGVSAPSFKVHIDDPLNTGLRVQTNAPGGTVASFGGFGALRIDAPGLAGGRFSVLENGNVGVGTANPVARLQVQGGNVYIGNPSSLVITSPNGACWFLTVNDAGALATMAVSCP
jgi:hypothetical protein